MYVTYISIIILYLKATFSKEVTQILFKYSLQKPSERDDVPASWCPAGGLRRHAWRQWGYSSGMCPHMHTLVQPHKQNKCLLTSLSGSLPLCDGTCLVQADYQLQIVWLQYRTQPICSHLNSNVTHAWSSTVRLSACTHTHVATHTDACTSLVHGYTVELHTTHNYVYWSSEM